MDLESLQPVTTFQNVGQVGSKRLAKWLLVWILSSYVEELQAHPCI